MSQVRLAASASSRVLERSGAARQISHSQQRYFHTQLHAYQYACPLTNLRCRSRSKDGYGVTSSVVLDAFYFTRSASTNAPETSTTVGKSTEPPPPSVPNKKAKIELRPGPAKTSANAKATTVVASHPENVKSQVLSDTKPHPTKPPPLAATSPKEEILTEEEGKSVASKRKKDLDEAARHGILAPPPEGASRLGKLWHQAKELSKFYMAGIKYIYVHTQEARKIRERVKNGGPPLSWREHKFLTTNKSDLTKLVPFLLIVLLIEETIPLIVIYAPGMLPSTCVLPSQRERMEATRHERQREAYAFAKATDVFKDVPIEQLKFNALDSVDTGLLCKTVGLPSWGIFGMQRYRLRRFLRNIAVEDKLLLAEGKGARLKQAEIASALTDRGFLANPYTPPQQRDRLRWWLENIKVYGSSEKSPEDVRAQLLVLMHQEASL